MISTLGWIGMALAALPLLNMLVNAFWYRRPRRATGPGTGLVSVLIPARNEASTLDATLRSVRAQRGIDFEVIVLDDSSEDGTDAIAVRHVHADSRVRLLTGLPLRPGWNGKQYACAQLVEAARGGWLVFIDADVELAPDALADMVDHAKTAELDLLSGIPRQRVGGLAESAVVPLIHFVLLGYLPMLAAQLSRSPGFAAGCGQVMVARRRAYRAAGGHGAIRATRHDGLALPRLFRRAGLRTGLADLSALASCRMYRGAREVWAGFAKNADEAMATPRALPVWTLLLGGQLLALLPAIASLSGAASSASFGSPVLTVGGAALFFAPALWIAARFGYPPRSVVLHPVALLALLAIQWQVLLRGRAGWRRCLEGTPGS